MSILALGVAYRKSHKEGSEAVVGYWHGKLTMKNHEISSLCMFLHNKSLRFSLPFFYSLHASILLTCVTCMSSAFIRYSELQQELENKYSFIVCSQNIWLRSCTLLNRTVLWAFCHIKMGKLRCCLAFLLPILYATLLTFVIKIQTALNFLTRINSTNDKSFKMFPPPSSSLTQDSHKWMTSLFLIPVKPFLAKLVHLRVTQ